MEISSIAIGRKIEYRCLVAGIGGSSHLIVYVFKLCRRSVKNFKRTGRDCPKTILESGKMSLLGSAPEHRKWVKS